MSLISTRLSPSERPTAPAVDGPTRGPRVLMIVESAAGGTGRHVLDLCEGLIARGAEVHLIHSTVRLDRFFRERLAGIDGLRTLALPMRTSIHPSDVRLVAAVRRYLRAHGPFDAVHGHSSKGGAVARLAALGTGAATFYTLHGFIIMDPSLARWKRLFYLTIEVLLSWPTRGIIAVSPEESRAAVRLGLGRSRVRLVPNGIGPIALTARAEARRALGVADDAFVVGFVGRLVEQKAPDVLLRAFARAVATAPAAPWVLAMVGSGPLGESLREQAGGLGVSDRVLWLGERDARGVLAAFDVFALSSRKEGLPYVVLEAMAAGLPVVATASSGVEILVEPGRTGAVVPVDDEIGFAAALAELACDASVCARQGRAARERAGRFDLRSMVEGTLTVYRGQGQRAAAPVDVARLHHDAAFSPGRTLGPARSQRSLLGGAVAATALSTVATANPAPAPPPALPTYLGEPPVAIKPRSSEMHPGPGFRIRTDIPRLDPGLMQAFREFATPDISDLLNRLYAVNPAIRCLTGDGHALCGPALTVKVFPGDNLMVHKSLDVARPGDVVVVDAGGATTNAVLGDLISAKARHRGISGFVVDGLVRDLPEIASLDFPVFARGTTPIGPLHRGPGEINHPICCGGIVVNPGDLVVADAAGVVVVPQEIAAELLRRLQQHKEANQSYFEAVRRGEFSNAWVDRVLAEAGCVVPVPVPVPAPTAATPDGWQAAGWPVNSVDATLPRAAAQPPA